MIDIFEHLNELNITKQGKNENILTCSDNVKDFEQKTVLWKTELRQGLLEMFPRRNQNKTIDKEFVLGLGQEHLALLHKKYDHYLFTIDTEQSGWIRNPFLANVNTRIILAC